MKPLKETSKNGKPTRKKESQQVNFEHSVKCGAWTMFSNINDTSTIGTKHKSTIDPNCIPYDREKYLEIQALFG